MSALIDMRPLQSQSLKSRPINNQSGGFSVPNYRELAAVAALCMLVSACGGSASSTSSAGPGAPLEAPSATLGGTISGLTQSGLVLANGAQTLDVVTGATAFTFATTVPVDQSYAVTVKSQPTGQNCTTANSSGTMSATGTTAVAITCVDVVVAPSNHLIGGTIGGLDRDGLVLANGADSVAVQAGATSFIMPTAQLQGSSYAVTVTTQPAGRTCDIAQGSGTVGVSDVATIAISCHGGYLTSTLAGSDTAGSSDATGANASFNRPSGLAVDSHGNVFVADQGNNLVRRITPTGAVATWAGSGSAGAVDASGAGASFSAPRGLAVDASGNVIVADSGNNKIRRIATDRAVSTLSGTGARGATDGAGNVAAFSMPAAVALDLAGNVLVADSGNNAIRVIAPDGSTSTRVLSGSYANPWLPDSLAIDATGNVYATQTTCVLLKISASGFTQPVPGGSCTFGFTQGPAFNAKITSAPDGTLYIADQLGMVIRRISASGVMSIVAGTLGVAGHADGSNATFTQLQGITIDGTGNLYVVDGNRIRKLTPQ
jgi:serine/threonine-protein kinase